MLYETYSAAQGAADGINSNHHDITANYRARVRMAPRHGWTVVLSYQRWCETPRPLFK